MRSENSVYSHESLQRILDHWGIGQIEEVRFFGHLGKNIWRHRIETNQGDFELYSYPIDNKEHYFTKLNQSLRQLFFDQKVLEQKKMVQSFDRCHHLVQLSKKERITVKQANKDLDLLLGASIKKAFRVYGSILQMHLNEANVNEASVLVSYGNWSLQEWKDVDAKLIVNSGDSYEQMDVAIESIEKDTPTIKKYVLRNGFFEIFLSNEKSLHFSQSGKFPAAELHLFLKRRNLLIFHEDEIYYTRSC